MVFRKSFGVARAGPVGDLVNGARMIFEIIETLGDQGPVTVLVTPCGTQYPQGQTKALGVKVGAAGGFYDWEAAQLHDEFESLRAGHGVPTDPVVAIFEVPSSDAPQPDGHRFTIL